MKKTLTILSLCLSLWLFGCGKQSLSGGTFGSSGLSSSSSISIPENLKPALSIEITNPPRGTYFLSSQTTVTVEGTVNDPKYTVISLRVNGQDLAVPTNGQFSAQVNLEPGMNILWAMAKNSEGGRAISAVAVMRGDYKQDNLVIPNAALVQIGKNGLDKVTKVVKPLLTTLDIEGKLKALNPLYETDIFVAKTKITLESLTYANPDITLTLGNGNIGVAISLDNLDLKARAQGHILGINHNLLGDIGATKVNASTTAYLSVTNGVLKVSFQNTTLNLTGFYFTFPDNNFLNYFANLAKGPIESLIVKTVKNLLDQKVPPMLANVFTNLQKPIKKTLLGKDLEITFIPQSANVTSNYIFMNMSGNVKVTNPAVTLPAPGSFYTPSTAPSLSLNNSEFVASINDDLLNRILFTAWKSGLLNLTINEDFFKKLNIASPIALNGGLLLKFYPELITHINDTDPVSLKIESNMPPVVRVMGSPDIVEVSLGEVGIDFVVHQGALERSALKVRAHLKVSATITVVDGKLKLNFFGKPNILGDVTEEPMKDVDENKVELLLNVVAPVILPQLTKSIQDIPLPSLMGISLDQLNLQQDGISNDFLTVFGSLKVQ